MYVSKVKLLIEIKAKFLSALTFRSDYGLCRRTCSIFHEACRGNQQTYFLQSREIVNLNKAIVKYVWNVSWVPAFSWENSVWFLPWEVTHYRVAAKLFGVIIREVSWTGSCVKYLYDKSFGIHRSTFWQLIDENVPLSIQESGSHHLTNWRNNFGFDWWSMSYKDLLLGLLFHLGIKIWDPSFIYCHLATLKIA